MKRKLSELGKDFREEYKLVVTNYLNTDRSRYNILNSQIHAILVDKPSLDAAYSTTGKKKLTKKQYIEILKGIKLESNIISKSITTFDTIELQELLKTSTRNKLLFIVDNILVGRSYKSMQDLVSKVFTNDTIVEESFAVGHTYLPGSTTNITPATYAIGETINYLSTSIKSKPYLDTLSNIETVFSKQYSKIHRISTKLTMSMEVSQSLARLGVVLVIPQESYNNSSVYGIQEKKVFNAIHKKLQALVDKYSLIELSASPSFKDNIEQLLINKIIGKSTSRINKVTTISSSDSIKYKQKLSIKAHKLKATSGKFQSVTNLAFLLNARLLEQVSANMTRPALVYRTGRLANSVKLQHVQYDNRTNEVSAFLTYMKYPYQTFEPGFAKGSKARDPRVLITKSVREIAASLTKARMKTIII